MIDNEIKKALEILRSGGIILYPTDTVWGLGCDATNEEAVAKIYEIKKREDSKSMILLASDLDMICRYIKEIPEIAVQLVEVNDKPMTIIYPGAMGLAKNVIAEDGTVGIRIPDHNFCHTLIQKLGRPIVSTSANISGKVSPKKFAEISEEIKEAVDYVVNPDLESESTGKPSSIIKVGVDYTIKIIRD